MKPTRMRVSTSSRKELQATTSSSVMVVFGFTSTSAYSALVFLGPSMSIPSVEPSLEEPVAVGAGVQAFHQHPAVGLRDVAQAPGDQRELWPGTGA